MLVPSSDWPDEGYAHTMNRARMRAVENGYSMLRVDFDGVSAAFDPYGRVLALQNTIDGQQHVIFANLPIRGARTLYNRTGDVFGWMCVAAALVLCVCAFRQRIPNEAK